ncbi:hypothetical protein Ga0074812_14930 [Parafrankia irregularis]|uniref:Uncharacterized protein n=1 Tax=Parafrankia irregularis TaxID=795642 RepID=A0A0S4R1V1_9ACTN|nr:MULTISPECIES: hypothetical protein [Frankiaceae]KPM50310.1 hypothetical protein ACG83_40950 [Frankia sp. R43]MBE3204710.1 hypothetical protein [Parafrankia sp. CH37]CUU60886.1 hypothetical protein Ga0074812_14930 [Parafrankia irregularis]
MYPPDLLAEVHGDEDLAAAVVDYADVRQNLLDLVSTRAIPALNTCLQGIHDDGDSYVDSDDLAVLLGEVTDLLRRREQLLDHLRTEGITIADAREAVTDNGHLPAQRLPPAAPSTGEDRRPRRAVPAGT